MARLCSTLDSPNNAVEPMTPSVSALLVQPLVLAVANTPNALDDFFAATDLTHALIADVDARVTPAQLCVAWAQAIRVSGDATLALRIADATPVGAFGVVEYVCRAAPTVGDALVQWVRYLRILNDAVTVGLVENGAVVHLRVLEDCDARAPASHELCFALVAARLRELATRWVPLVSVDFAHRVENPAAYERFFDAPVRFGCETTQLSFQRAALASPMKTADPALLAILTRHADALTTPPRTTDRPFTAQVRRVLATALRSNEGHVDAVAKHLAVTTRSLQRRMKEEGSSFNAVREEVRRDLAHRYIDEGMALSEVAFLLGFSEPSAFFRAFKRWTGLTPLESKSARRASAAAS